MLTPGNYKVKESRLIVGEDGTTRLELDVRGYPRSFTAQFGLVPVQSQEDREEQAAREWAIVYLKVKFNWDEVQGFVEFADTEDDCDWMQYIATNAQTGKITLQREDLVQDVIKFLDRES